MPSRHIVLTLAAALLAPVAAHAAGSTTTLATVGGWSAFGGTSSDGSSVCGMLVKDDATSRYLMIKHFETDNYIIVQAVRPSWNMRQQTPLDVYMKLDSHAAWQGTGTGYQDRVEWRINGDKFFQFVKEFQSSNRLIVSFPQGSEAPWTASLYGSAAIANVWMRCMTTIQFQPTSPAPTSPAPSSPAPTSPAPRSPAPTSPAPPVARSAPPHPGPDIGV